MGDNFSAAVDDLVSRCKASIYVAPEATVAVNGYTFDADALRENFAAIVSVLNSETGRRVLALAEALTPNGVKS